jgi:hypothetical protein
MRAIGQGADDIAIRLRSHETEGVTASDRYHLRNEAAAEIDSLRDLLRRIAKANVIFPSMCANNMEAYNLNDELRRFIDRAQESK